MGTLKFGPGRAIPFNERYIFGQIFYLKRQYSTYFYSHLIYTHCLDIIISIVVVGARFRYILSFIIFLHSNFKHHAVKFIF